MALKKKFELTPEIPQRIKREQNKRLGRGWGGQGGIIKKTNKPHASSYAISSFTRLVIPKSK